MSKRYFEYMDEKSNKFWEITVYGNKHEIKYGKIGTEGRKIVKEFEDEESASKEAEALIKSKLKKGYIEVRKKVNTIIELLTNMYSFYAEKSPDEFYTHKLAKAEKCEIDEYEKLIGEKLPDDYITFLLENDFEFSFDANFKVLSIKESINDWIINAELLDKGTFDDGRIEATEENGNWVSGFIKKVWWNKKWIPVSEDSCGNLYCIDLDPGENGRKYQMMNMEFQDGQGPFATKYTSFTDYLEKHLGYLKNGQYNSEDGYIFVDSYKKPRDGKGS